MSGGRRNTAIFPLPKQQDTLIIETLIKRNLTPPAASDTWRIKQNHNTELRTNKSANQKPLTQQANFNPSPDDKRGPVKTKRQTTKASLTSTTTNYQN